MNWNFLKISSILVGLAFLLSPAFIAGYKVFSKTGSTNSPTPQIIEIVEEEIQEVFITQSPTAAPQSQDNTFTPLPKKIDDNDDESENKEREDDENESPQEDD